MSLPTYGIFYKNENYVGAGFCNVGWFMSDYGLVRCIREAMDNAWEFYRENPSFELNERERQYFTNEEDLRSFDYLKIYSYNFPREFCMKIYDGEYGSGEMLEFMKESKIEQ